MGIEITPITKMVSISDVSADHSVGSLAKEGQPSTIHVPYGRNLDDRGVSQVPFKNPVAFARWCLDLGSIERQARSSEALFCP